MSQKCNRCFDGKVVNPDHEDEADRLYESGQFSYYEAILKAGYIKCPTCNGTGKIE